jgi:hypothetical protein
VKLPTSISVLLSALAAAVVTLSTQLHLSSTMHIVIAAGLVFLAGLGIHPAGESSAPEAAPPFGLPAPGTPALQPPVTAAEPAARTLP